MIEKAAIEVEGLGKHYRLGGQAQLDQTLPEAISRIGRNMMARLRGKPVEKVTDDREFWALKNVSFALPKGEVLGVIGRNGAGKSTLLKILSQITDPTQGQAVIHGRVASLLEVGTGFHPELSGRENIYLNGSILGMPRSEIKAKFDDIVAFSGVEKFLDTPVKRYSSGMKVRLAFSVAAHLDPEILIVDEVLAVGDAAFQRKCLGKMQDVASGMGRTVLFVSHNMTAIKHLCKRCVVLEDGQVVFEGPSDQAVKIYQNQVCGLDVPDGKIDTQRWTASKRVHISDIRVTAPTDDGLAQTGAPVAIEIDIDAKEPLIEPGFAVDFRTPEDVRVFRASTILSPDYQAGTIIGPATIRLDLPCLPLASGHYILDLRITRPMIETIFDLPAAMKIEVAPGDFYGVGVPIKQKDGLVVAAQSWSLGKADQHQWRLAS